MTTRKRLTFFTAGYSQAAVIFPILVAAPRYFSGAISVAHRPAVAKYHTRRLMLIPKSRSLEDGMIPAAAG